MSDYLPVPPEHTGRRSKQVALVLLGTMGVVGGVIAWDAWKRAGVTANADNTLVEQGPPAAPVAVGRTYSNNEYVPGVGYYHAPYNAWYPHPYNHHDPDRGYFGGGLWQAVPFILAMQASAPNPSAVASANLAQQRYAQQQRARAGSSGFNSGSTRRPPPPAPPPFEPIECAAPHCGETVVAAHDLQTLLDSALGLETLDSTRRLRLLRQEPGRQLRLMKRLPLTPRTDWQAKAEALGFTYHTHEGSPYWDESACYVFSSRQVDELEAAANTLNQLCIDAAQVVIDRGWWTRLGIPEKAVPTILASWNRDDPSLYGRFDLAYDGESPPKLLEYNADTPTALIEAAVVQWYWLQELFPRADQFNSIHERLIEAWRNIAAERVHFAAVSDLPEDTQTITYLMDTCQQAGFQTKWLPIESLGWDSGAARFVDTDDEEVNALFKLYPWEWMWHETFAEFLPTAKNLFIEPPWKLLLSNKGLLPILWELNPGHPNLLPAFESAHASLGGNYVRKPLLSREGANVTLVERGSVVEENTGDYGAEGFIYQALASIPDFAGHRPVCGVWIVNHEACGLGIREDTRRITGNLSRFVPHRME